MTNEEELLSKVNEGLKAMHNLQGIYTDRMQQSKALGSIPASQLDPPNNYVKELLEQGSRSEGPFTEEIILNNPRVLRAVKGALTHYIGSDRFCMRMKELYGTGLELTVKQWRAVANVIYQENKR